MSSIRRELCPPPPMGLLGRLRTNHKARPPTYPNSHHSNCGLYLRYSVPTLRIISSVTLSQFTRQTWIRQDRPVQLDLCLQRRQRRILVQAMNNPPRLPSPVTLHRLFRISRNRSYLQRRHGSCIFGSWKARCGISKLKWKDSRHLERTMRFAVHVEGAKSVHLIGPNTIFCQHLVREVSSTDPEREQEHHRVSEMRCREYQ